jgi:hypothetical protein
LGSEWIKLSLTKKKPTRFFSYSLDGEFITSSVNGVFKGSPRSDSTVHPSFSESNKDEKENFVEKSEK